jgi:hypothetical protein
MSNNACGQLGAIQTRGTCWFYSILNGFILSEDGQKILYNRLTNFYKKLKPAEKAYFDDAANAPCPMKNLAKTKEIYFWKFIDQYLCFMSGPRAATLKAGKSASILGGMSLQGSVAKNLGGRGAYPQVEIEKILDHVGFKGEYYVKYANTPPKFHAGRKPQFIVVMANSDAKKKYMDRIPSPLLEDEPKYELMCASLVIANTYADLYETHKWHAVAGFKCNGQGYIYDSNQRKVFKCDWWNPIAFRKVANDEIANAYKFFKGGQINVHQYAFAIFARKEFTKNIGVSCLLKHKVKTPNTRLNFTDPNLGKKLNSNMFNYLNPAQVAALKRKWARTEHRNVVYLNQATYNSIINSAKNFASGMNELDTLIEANYKIKDPKNYNEFMQKLRNKFAPAKTLTYANAKARLAPFTKSTAAVRKHQYSLVWKGLPMAQRKVLMHWRNKGEWLANNAFENKPKPPIKRKPKPPSPSPLAKRATQVRTNFEKYWSALQPNNRKMLRNYIAAYKSPKSLSPTTKKNSNTLVAAKHNVNALETAKARKEYQRKRAVNMNQANWTALGRYIAQKNAEARYARSVKRVAKA